MPAPDVQPEPAEGPREDAGARPEHADGEGVSAQTPAEGGDDVSPPIDGSPRG